MEAFADRIKQHIKDADLGEALNILETSFAGQRDEVILLKSQYSNLVQEELKGVLSQEQKDRMRNQLSNQVLEFLKVNLARDRELFGTIWKERQNQNSYISEQAIKTVSKSLVVHDSFFIRNRDHKWEKAIDYCLEQGHEVTLILAHPSSEVYRQRKAILDIDNPSEKLTKSVNEKLDRYPENFQLLLTDRLYSGPFVFIDEYRLFLGMFLFSVHSEDLPIFEFLRTDEENKIFQSVETWIHGLAQVRP